MKVKGVPLFLLKIELVIERPLKEVSFFFPRLVANHNYLSKLLDESTWYYMNDTSSPEQQIRYIIQTVSRSHLMFEGSETCVSVSICYVDEDKVIYIQEQSNILPLSNKFVRSHNGLGGIFFQALSPTSTQVVLMLDNDPKTSRPNWLVSHGSILLFQEIMRMKTEFETEEINKYPVNYKPLKEIISNK